MVSNPTPNYVFQPTTNSKSERLLANSLGYPKSWHVVRRTIPITNTNPNKKSKTASSSSTDPTTSSFSKTCIDTIHAGPPDANVDTYYNHSAAYEAATKWVEGTSTPYDDKGGQMLPRKKVVYSVGDRVEVFYEQDESWYEAKVIKTIKYQDDIRYTVYYTADDATQSNIHEDQMRALPKKKPKRKPKATPPPKTKAPSSSSSSSSSPKKKQIAITTFTSNTTSTTTATTTNTKKRKAETIVSVDASPALPNLPTLSKPKPKPERKHQSVLTANPRLFKPTKEARRLARRMGLPEGWTAMARSNSRYTFRNPTGDKRFLSKKAVFDYLGLPLPPPGKITIYDSDSSSSSSSSSSNSSSSSSSSNESDKNKKKNPINIPKERTYTEESSTETEDESSYTPISRSHPKTNPKPTTTTTKPTTKSTTKPSTKPTTTTTTTAVDSTPNQPQTTTVVVKKGGIIPALEDGDPPWRTTNHQYLGREVRYRFAEDSDNKRTYIGIVRGWISSSDVDKDGEPGFLSEKTGKPAALFHVRFDSMSCPFLSQDLEEYELLECIIPVDENVREEEEGRVEAQVPSSDENETLSDAIKNVIKKNKTKDV